MPGFIVNGIGGDAVSAVPPTNRYYYTYLWNISYLFDDVVRSSSPVINAKDMTLPSYVVAKEMLIGGSVEYKFAKSVNYDDVKITWYDSLGLLSILKRWRESVWTPATGLAPPGEYKRTVIQRQYLSDGSTSLIDDVSFRLFGAWPSSIRYGDLTYTNSDIKIVEMNITYDFAVEYSGDPDNYIIPVF